MCGRGLPNRQVRRRACELSNLRVLSVGLFRRGPILDGPFENTERMLITRAVTVRGVLFLRPPDTMTLSSSTVFDVVAEAREP
jgi:hypothetical protein